MTVKSILSTICLVLFLFAAGGCSKTANTIDPPRIEGLTETQIEHTNLSISLPAGYVISESRQEDFSIFRFAPRDTTVAKPLIGGFYMGNHPGTFEPENDQCSTDSRESDVFGSSEEWTVFKCTDKHSIQVTIDNPNAEKWNEYLHLFGTAYTQQDMDRLLQIFSTLRSK